MNSPGLQRAVFLLLLAIVTAAFVWVLSPFFGAVFWAVIMALLFNSTFEALLRRLRGRRNLAALLTLLFIILIVVLPTVLLSVAAANEVSTLVAKVSAGDINFRAYAQQVLAALRLAGGRWDVDEDRAPKRRATGSSTDAADLVSTSSAAASLIEPIEMEQRDPHLVPRESEQINLMIGTQGLRAGDPRRFAFGIMNAVLGGGMSSRLFQEIREKRGLAYTAYSFGASYSDGGVFGMYAGTMPEKAAQVAELARAELQGIASGGITEEEHARALGQISGSSALALEDSDTRMGRLARAELGAGELFTLDASLERFQAVTAEQIREVAAFVAAGPQSIVAVGDVARASL